MSNLPIHVATCPVCGSRDEYFRPDPVEHTCGHRKTTVPPQALTAAVNAAQLWRERTLMSRTELGYDAAMLNAALDAAVQYLDFGAGYEAGRNLYRSGAYINGKRDALHEMAVWCAQKAAAVGEPDSTTLLAVALHARERAK